MLFMLSSFTEAPLSFAVAAYRWPHNLHTWLISNSSKESATMFDQLVKRSNAVWIYTTGRFAEERRAFLCHLSGGGRSLLTLRNVNKLLLVIAERVNIRQRTPITELQIVRAANNWVHKSCAPTSTTETRDTQTKGSSLLPSIGLDSWANGMTRSAIPSSSRNSTVSLMSSGTKDGMPTKLFRPAQQR